MVNFWENYSFILRGNRRKRVLLYLSDPKIPKQIAQECNMSLSNVKASLIDLEKRDLIKCLTPKQRIGRVYKLTEEGKKLKDYLLKTKK
ncbi:MAG: ArsR family transcriptional regulator [Nanoarchaeota archaeon]